MSPARTTADPGDGPVLPTATWASFEAALDLWRATGVPRVVAVAALPGGGSGPRQVIQTLGALGFLEPDGQPGLALRRLVRHQQGLVDALRERWPDLLAAIESRRPVDDAATAFSAVPAASEHTARRFRTFVLHACQLEGIDVAVYRRLGARAAPAGPRRAANRRRPSQRSDSGPALAASQLLREAATYEAALRSAIERDDSALAARWSKQLALLRQEQRRDDP
jgi:hypothetical protein